MNSVGIKSKVAAVKYPCIICKKDLTLMCNECCGGCMFPKSEKVTNLKLKKYAKYKSR